MKPSRSHLSSFMSHRTEILSSVLFSLVLGSPRVSFSLAFHGFAIYLLYIGCRWTRRDTCDNSRVSRHKKKTFINFINLNSLIIENNLSGDGDRSPYAEFSNSPSDLCLINSINIKINLINSINIKFIQIK